MTTIYGKICQSQPFSRTHLKIIELVGKKKKVLELGCSTGYLTYEFGKNGCHVDVVEKDSDDILEAKKFAQTSLQGDLDNEKLLDKLTDQYDVVVASEILEHLKDPLIVLKKIKRNLKKGGRLIISMPNIATWSIRRDLFFKGKFEYQESGILDRTHLRFYTYQTVQDLVREAGFSKFKMIATEIDYPFRKSILKNSYLEAKIDPNLTNFLLNKFPNFCVQHYIVEVHNG